METKHRIHPIILAHAREMRHPQTAAEATLWRALRNRKIGFKFRRQNPIDRFIIDLYCAEAKLLIEVDGESHLEADQAEYDNARTGFLEELGYKVIRFTNDDVRYNIGAVISEILLTVRNRIIELNDLKNLTLPSPRSSPRRERGKD